MNGVDRSVFYFIFKIVFFFFFGEKRFQCPNQINIGIHQILMRLIEKRSKCHNEIGLFLTHFPRSNKKLIDKI